MLKVAGSFLALLLVLQGVARAEDAGPLEMGRQLVKERKWQEAVAQFTKAIEAEPNSAEAFFLRGDTLAKIPKPDEALKDFNEAIRLKPDYVEAWYMKGHIHARKAQHAQAVKAFAEAERLRPDFAEAHHYRGLSFLQQKKFAPAKEEFEKAVELKPRYAEAYYFLGVIGSETRSLGESLQAFDKALAIEPNHGKWHYERGEVQMWMGEEEKALADFTDAIRLDPTRQHSYNDRAYIYASRRQFDLAVADLTEAIRLQPELPFFRQNRGADYFELKQYENALADFEVAIQLRPDIASYYSWRARANVALHRPELARPDLEKAATMPTADFRTYSNLGLTYEALQEQQLALKYLDKALEKNESAPTELANRAWLRVQVPNLEGATEDALAAIELSPTYILPYVVLAKVAARQGNLEEAKKRVDAALKIDGTAADALYERGQISFRLGRYAETVADHEKYVAANSWRTDVAVYFGILRVLAMRHTADQKAAREMASEVLVKWGESRWPGPVLSYLAGELPEEGLMKRSTTPEKQTEAHAYAGLKLAAEGKGEAALTHLRWVKEQGVRTFSEVQLIKEEQARLESGAKTP